MHKNKISFSCFVLLAFLFITMRVGAGQTWMTWNTSSGLPSNNLSCLAISKGIIAVGSDKGIGLFLENHTGWFNLADFHEQLAGLAVRSLDFDDHSTLWAATPAGLIAIELENFPESAPRIRCYDNEHGLSTIDVEVVQVVNGKIYVGCYGGWLFSSEIAPGSSLNSFLPVNRPAFDDLNKFMSVGITALAMDYPEGGIYSTRGKGLLRAADGGNLVGEDELFSDWVNDFWAFEDGNATRIIAATQNQMNLISNNRPAGNCSLPLEDCWISSVTTADDKYSDEYKPSKPEGYEHLETFLGKRTLFIGTRGKGLWIFDDGRWNNLTTRDSPLPSDNINKIHYLPGPKKIAILSEGGLTMMGVTEYDQFDIFRSSGSYPYWAKTFWPFMQSWGPYVYGYPSQKSYPIEPFIAYGKMLRGKDIWIAHERGLSRFVFPSSPFIGVMQYRFHLAGRFEATDNDPTKNLAIEDDSMVFDRPPAAPGEELWHHYCKEQPTDFCLAPISQIYVSDDMKTIVGPGEYVMIEASSVDEVSGEDIRAAFAEYRRQHPETVSNGYPASDTHTELFDDVSGTADDDSTASNEDTSAGTSSAQEPQPRLTRALIRVGDEIYNSGDGKQLRAVASLMRECPLHPIPSLAINDFVLDLSDRVWMIYDDNRLACLDSQPGNTVPDPANNDWYEFPAEVLPWEKFDDLLCIQRIGSSLYVSSEKSGVYFLPIAHTVVLSDLRSSDWRRIQFPQATFENDLFKNIIAVEHWKTESGPVVALLSKKGLATFDGNRLDFIDVPERNYTCMVQDRHRNLWLGSLQGLSYLTPAGKLKDIHGKANFFYSEKVTSMAAAPDDAKYPYIIAVAVDEFAQTGKGPRKIYGSSDPPPSLVRGRFGHYSLKVLNAQVDSSQIMLYDGKKWEPMFRPGVRAMMFDQEFLWITTSCRVVRLHIPVVVQSY